MVKIAKNRILLPIFTTAQRARNRARPHGARQQILLSKEILFDYLIASVAQKLEKKRIIWKKKIKKVQNFENFVFRVFELH